MCEKNVIQCTPLDFKRSGKYYIDFEITCAEKILQDF